MNVVILTSFPFPNGKATANRIRAFSDEMQKNAKIGHIEIICCSPEKSGQSFFSSSIRVSNIQVSHVNKSRLVLRALHEISIAFKLWRKANSISADVVLVTVPSIFLLLPIIFSKKQGAIALDVRDAVWTYLGGDIISIMISSIIKKVFSIAAKKADIISVTNNWEALHVETLTGKAPLIISNGISRDRLLQMREVGEKILEKPVKLAYVGNVGIAQELNHLLDFSRRVPDLEVIIVGDGAKLNELKAQCHTQRITNVIFTGAVSPDMVLEYMKAADILFAQIGANFMSAVPTKVFEYIAAGRRVLLGLPIGPARELFSKFHGVEIFEVGNKLQLEASYKTLLGVELNQGLVEENLRMLEANHSRETDSAYLIHTISEVVVA